MLFLHERVKCFAIEKQHNQKQKHLKTEDSFKISTEPMNAQHGAYYDLFEIALIQIFTDLKPFDQTSNGIRAALSLSSHT